MMLTATRVILLSESSRCSIERITDIRNGECVRNEDKASMFRAQIRLAGNQKGASVRDKKGEHIIDYIGTAGVSDCLSRNSQPCNEPRSCTGKQASSKERSLNG